MTDDWRAEQRARIGRHLEAARGLFEDADGPGVADYRNDLEHDLLEVAFDILVEVGVNHRARQAFWQRVQEAAIGLGLTVSSSLSTRGREVAFEAVEDDLEAELEALVRCRGVVGIGKCLAPGAEPGELHRDVTRPSPISP